MSKAGSLDIRSGEEVIGKTKSFLLTVIRVDGDWLEVRDYSVEGWVPRNDVVLLENAVEHFTQEIQKDPRSAGAYHRRGIARLFKGEDDATIRDFNEAIRLDPNEASFYDKRADYWFGKNDYDKAMNDFDEAIRLDPEDQYAYRGRGLVWSKKREYDKAIVDYSEAIRLDPKDYVAYLGRGNDWVHKEEYDKAIDDYDEADQLEPKNEWLYLNRGNAWQDKEEYDKAIADYSEAVRLDPKNSAAYYNRGNVWRQQAEYDKAIADYNEVIRLDPTDTMAYNNRGRAWHAKSEYDKAIADFSKAIRLDPKYNSAFRNRGDAWHAKSEYDKAIADYNEALRFWPMDAESYSRRGSAWKSKGEYEKTLRDFNLAIGFDPENARAYNGRAWLWATCPNARYRDGGKAAESAKQACELTEWKEPNYIDTLAAAYAESGNFDEAAKAQTQAMDLAAEDDKAEYQARLALYQERKPYREEESVSPVNTATVVTGNTEFAFDLYSRLRTQDGNLFFSPYSISTALAMTYGGAASDTQAEMAKVLHFPQDQEPLHAAFADLISQLQSTRIKRAYQLHIANAFWAQQDYKFSPIFFQLIEDRYRAALKDVDFRHDPEVARQAINRWVEGQTNQKIKDLLQSGTVDAETKLVLTSAIYFKARWAETFSKEQTIDEDFFTARPATLKVPMMHQTDSFRYLDGGNFQLLELPYKGDELSMLVVLPKKVDGLEDVEKSLSAAILDQWAQKLERHSVDVSLPKFSTAAEFKLKDTLVSMGMQLPFDRDRADFSAMIDRTQGLCIGAVIHKAFVDVDEDGTEAAAATAVIMAPGAGAVPHDQKQAVFRADHPFLFLIRETASGSILFMGRVARP